MDRSIADDIFLNMVTLPRLVGASCLLLAVSAVTNAHRGAAQTVIMPAAPKAETPMVWNCRVEEPVGATMIHASRQLDAEGDYVSDSAGWTDLDVANPTARLTISIDWNSRDKRSRFADGMATFFFRTDRAMSWPLELALGSTTRLRVPAGPADINPREFVGYAPIGKVLATIGDRADLRWALNSKSGRGRAAGFPFEGAYAPADLLRLEAGYARALARLDAIAPDFASRCARLK